MSVIEATCVLLKEHNLSDKEITELAKHMESLCHLYNLKTADLCEIFSLLRWIVEVE